MALDAAFGGNLEMTAESAGQSDWLTEKRKQSLLKERRKTLQVGGL